MATMPGGSGDNSVAISTNVKFTPMPPQKSAVKAHAKKAHVNDSRVQLAPLAKKHSVGLTEPTPPGPATSSWAHSDASPPFGVTEVDRVDGDVLFGVLPTLSTQGATPQTSPVRATSASPVIAQHKEDSKRSVCFFRQLASMRLLEAAADTASVARTTSTVLAAVREAVGADLVVLYAVCNANLSLKVVASTDASAMGLFIPIDKYPLARVLTMQHEKTGVSGSSPATLYLSDLLNTAQYSQEQDVDARTKWTTVSVLATVIAGVQGANAYILEARCKRHKEIAEIPLTTAAITLENVITQHDLTRALASTVHASSLLEELLEQTLRPIPVESTATFLHEEDDGASEIDADDQPEDAVGTAATAKAAVSREEQIWISSPPLNELTSKILNPTRSHAICLLEFHPTKKSCCVLATAQRESEGRVSELAREIQDGIRAMGDRDSTVTTPSALLDRFVGSVEARLVLRDLGATEELRAAAVALDTPHITFVPLPRNTAASYAGLICFSRDDKQLPEARTEPTALGYELDTLMPLLRVLSLAVLLTKKNDATRASTAQKTKLIRLYHSMFQIETVNDPSALVNLICEIGEEIFNTSRVTLYVADPIKRELWSLSTLGSVNGLRIPYGKGIAGTVAHTRGTLIVRNPYNDPRFDSSFDRKFGFKTESLITFAVLDKNGETLGVIQAVNSTQFLDAHVSPVIAAFDDQVLAVFKHLVSHALRVNSSLIMFAKVQADYWANRVVLAIDDDEDTSAKHDVASVHSLLDTSGFDNTKRVPRNKWSTFAYTCWAMGKFLSPRNQKRQATDSEGNALLSLAMSPLDESNSDEEQEHADSVGGTVPVSQGTVISSREKLRMRSRASFMRAGVASTMVTRWRRVTVPTTALEHDLVSDSFDTLSKSLEELKQYAFQLFDGLGLVTTFRIDQDVLRRFIDTLAGRYRDVPYHNFYHGFDVAHTAYRMIRETGVLSVVKEFEALSLVAAALGHDADHPGNDNQFEVDSGSSLALCYNDLSVLENHHAATTFAVLKTAGCDILQGLSLNMRSSIRTAMIRCILATDMKHHSKLISELSVISRVEDFENVADGRQLMLNMVIHGADLASMAKPIEITRKWVDLVCEEFTMQAMRSQELGVFVPPHIMNLQDEVVKSRLEVNFIDYLVSPLWTVIASILPESSSYVEYLRANREYYFERAGQMSARRSTTATHQHEIE